MLKRHAGRKDIIIDLTSLLDVVFLILFIVIQNGQAITNSNNEQLKTAVNNLDDKNAELAEAKQQLSEAQNDAETYRNELSTSQNFNSYAAVITITLDYQEDQPSTRYITAGGGGFNMERITMTPENEKTSWIRLREKLDEFIQNSSDKQIPVVITYKREGGSHRDYASLQNVLNDLHEKYDNLYVK